MRTKLAKSIGERLSSTNLNFLFGSGVSRPLLGTLGKVESLLTEALNRGGVEDLRILRLVEHEFFQTSIAPALALVNTPTIDSEQTLASFVAFYRALQAILHRRDSATEGMTARVFTTNYDPLSELALEWADVDYEDGFAGRIKPRFDIGNYGSLRYVRSQHFGMTREAPVVDVHKLHGSLTWHLGEDGSIDFDGALRGVEAVVEAISTDRLPRFRGGLEGRSYQSVLRSVVAHPGLNTSGFAAAYDKLAVVNPTSEKFESTVLQRAYYDQLRILSNELERTNTSLISLGFSFEDEHIRELVIRAADSNPTLTLFVFAFDSPSVERFNRLLAVDARANRNVRVVAPQVRTVDDDEIEIAWTLGQFTSDILLPNVSVNFLTGNR